MRDARPAIAPLGLAVGLREDVHDVEVEAQPAVDVVERLDVHRRTDGGVLGARLIGVEGGEVAVAIVERGAEVQLSLDVGDADVGHERVEARDAGVGREGDGVAGAVVALGLHARGVGEGAEAVPRRGQKGELLRVADLEALHFGEAAVELGRHDEAGVVAIEAVVRARRHGAGDGGVDELADVLLKHAHGEHAGGLEVELGRDVEIARALGLERGVVDRERLVVEVGAHARDQLADVRTANVLGVGGAREEVGRELVFEMQARQDRAVVAGATLAAAELLLGAPLDLGVGQRSRAPSRAARALLGREELPRALALGLGLLHAHAAEHAKAAELHVAHQVAGHDLLLELLVVVVGGLKIGREAADPMRGIRGDVRVEVVRAAVGDERRQRQVAVAANLGVGERPGGEAELREIVVVAPGGRVHAHHAVGADVAGVVGRVVEVTRLLAEAQAGLDVGGNR